MKTKSVRDNIWTNTNNTKYDKIPSLDDKNFMKSLRSLVNSIKIIILLLRIQVINLEREHFIFMERVVKLNSYLPITVMVDSY